MSPAVEALVEYAEELANPNRPRTTAVERLKLKALAYQVRYEDPLAVAFQQAQARFRAKEAR